ncbi:MAG TPA: response regulator transcription factor [Terriglobales bacterium]|nr:response regulator transcription factor [Terriglobales bacterium]
MGAAATIGSSLAIPVSRSVSVVIADDHEMFRTMLRRLLEDAQMLVVGEAKNGKEAVEAVRRSLPDILLLDLCMPEHPGLEALRELRESEPEKPVNVILLTADIRKEDLVRALHAGARGVVMKQSTTSVLFSAIQSVMSGEYWVGLSPVKDLNQYLRILLGSSSAKASPDKFGLTRRELQITSAVVSALSNKEIAQRFTLSVDTVKNHLRNIYDKTGVSNRLELAMFAVHHNLELPPTD